MGVRFVNNFNAPLASGATSGQTLLTLQSGYGSILSTKLGTSLGTDHIYGTLVNSANDVEIVKVTAISGDDLTVVRGADGSTPRPWLAGDIISMRACAAGLSEIVSLPDDLAHSGINLDITELRGLTVPLSISQGGTGTTTGAPAGSLFFTEVASKTSAYTVITDDRSKLIDATSGTWTLTLTSAVTLGNGFTVGVRNSGSGTITVSPATGQQINGSTGLSLSAGQSCLVVSTGTAWKTVGLTTTSSGGGGGSTVSGVLLGMAGSRTAGTVTGTRPAGATKALVMIQGGGGNGGTATMEGETGGGGGGGAYMEAVLPVTGNLTFTIGSAGGATSCSGSGFSTLTVAGGGHASGLDDGAGAAVPSAPVWDNISLPGQAGSAQGAGWGGGGFYAARGGGPGKPGVYGGGGGGGAYLASGGAGSAGYAIVYWYA